MANDVEVGSTVASLPQNLLTYIYTHTPFTVSRTTWKHAMKRFLESRKPNGSETTS